MWCEIAWRKSRLIEQKVISVSLKFHYLVFFLLKILFVKYQVSLNHFFTEALLDFMQHLPVSFYLVD